MDRRDKLGWVFLVIGIGLSAGAVALIQFLAPSQLAGDYLSFAAPVLFIWLGVAILLGAVNRPVRVLFLRAFDDDRDAFLVRYVRDICAQYGRVEAIRQPSRLEHTSIPLPAELGGITASDDRWQDVAIKLIRKARVVVIDLSNGSENVQWELARVRELAANRCIILVDRDTAKTIRPDKWLKENAVVYSPESPQKLQGALIKRLKRIRSPSRKIEARWKQIQDKSAEADYETPSLDISRCSTFAPLLLASSLGLWLTAFYCGLATLSDIIQQTNGPFMPLAVATTWWIGIVGLVLPRRILARADIWSIFSIIGLRSVLHCRVISGFFVLATIFVAIMFHVVADNP